MFGCEGPEKDKSQDITPEKKISDAERFGFELEECEKWLEKLDPLTGEEKSSINFSFPETPDKEYCVKLAELVFASMKTLGFEIADHKRDKFYGRLSALVSKYTEPVWGRPSRLDKGTIQSAVENILALKAAKKTAFASYSDVHIFGPFTISDFLGFFAQKDVVEYMKEKGKIYDGESIYRDYFDWEKHREADDRAKELKEVEENEEKERIKWQTEEWGAPFEKLPKIPEWEIRLCAEAFNQMVSQGVGEVGGFERDGDSTRVVQKQPGIVHGSVLISLAAKGGSKDLRAYAIQYIQDNGVKLFEEKIRELYRSKGKKYPAGRFKIKVRGDIKTGIIIYPTNFVIYAPYFRCNIDSHDWRVRLKEYKEEGSQ